MLFIQELITPVLIGLKEVSYLKAGLIRRVISMLFRGSFSFKNCLNLLCSESVTNLAFKHCSLHTLGLRSLYMLTAGGFVIYIVVVMGYPLLCKTVPWPYCSLPTAM